MRQTLFFALLPVVATLAFAGPAVADEAPVEVGGGGADLPVVIGDGDDLGAAGLAFLDDGALDAPAAYFVEEV